VSTVTKMQATAMRDVLEVSLQLTKQVILFLGALIMVLPFVWMLSTSLKYPPDVLAYPPQFIPLRPTLTNFSQVFATAPFGRFFLNSLFVSIMATVSILFTSLLAGFVFAKYSFPGRNLLFILILATAIVPLQTYMIPLYLMMQRLRLVNTYWGLVAPRLIMSYGIFFMRQNIQASLPDELIDAARIDGCSEWRIFVQIVVPLMRPAIGALGIFAFMAAWTDFIWPLLITSSRDLWTMELGLGMFQHKFTVEYGAVCAGSVISVLPILIVFLILRRSIIRGITLTGLKGV